MANGRRRSRRNGRTGKRSRAGLWSFLAVAVLLAAYLALIVYSRPQVDGRPLRVDAFIDLTTEGRILDARILDVDGYILGRYVRDDGSTGRYNTPYFRDAAVRELMLRLLLENRVPTTIEQQFLKTLVVPATLLLPAMILVVIFVYLLISHRRGTGLFGIRSGARKVKPDDARVTFADVAGQRHAVAELRELVEFLRDPSRFAALGAQIPKGVLLYGPPGCGKTLLAKALAGEAGASFYSISGSDFVELYVGVGAARVRDLFAVARDNAPAIVFIDELDSIGRARGVVGVTVSHGEQEQTLNQVLAEMDGFSPSDGIIVVGATNRPDILDQALLRPGRFDRTIGLERPDEQARLEILTLHARGKPMAPDVDLADVARRAIGLSGADLASVVNEGALLAGRVRRGAISQADLDEALRRIVEAPERQRRLAIRERSVARRYTSEERVTFADVAGVDDAVAELEEVRRYLAEPERFLEVGARVPRGILLAGPPGCGKTLLARAVAGEANAAFFSVAASEFVEVFVGEGASRVRELFAEARAAAPAIVFIDELDALGARRSAMGTAGSRENDQTLNQVLIELDGFEPRAGVIVMAATNRPDILDPALVRPGRFDRQVTIDPPDRQGRRRILEVHARGRRLASAVELDRIAAITRGFTGADLANVMNEAALLAVRRGEPLVTMSLLETAVERAVLGVFSRGRLLGDEERRLVAYHEAGHGLVGLALPGADPPHKLSILPRGTTLGFAWQAEAEERHLHTESALLDRMATSLGGRAAEELVFGEFGDGSGADLNKATEIARRMVCELGMSDALGPVAYADGDGPGRGFSDEDDRIIAGEIRRLLGEAYGRARDVLAGSRDLLDLVAERLLERETMSAEELESLVENRPRAAGSPAAARTPARARNR